MMLRLFTMPLLIELARSKKVEVGRVKAWQQCGGKNFNRGLEMECVSGYKCIATSIWYKGCKPIPDKAGGLNIGGPPKEPTRPEPNPPKNKCPDIEGGLQSPITICRNHDFYKPCGAGYCCNVIYPPILENGAVPAPGADPGAVGFCVSTKSSYATNGKCNGDHQKKKRRKKKKQV